MKKGKMVLPLMVSIIIGSMIFILSIILWQMQLHNHKNDLNKDSEKFAKFISEKITTKIENITHMYTRASSRWLLYKGENLDTWYKSIEIFTHDNSLILHSFFLDEYNNTIKSFGEKLPEDHLKNNLATYFHQKKEKSSVDYFISEDNRYFFIITMLKNKNYIRYLTGKIDLKNLFKKELSCVNNEFAFKIEDDKEKLIIKKVWDTVYPELENSSVISIADSRRWLVTVAPTKSFVKKQTIFLLTTPLIGIIFALLVSFLFYQTYKSRLLTRELKIHKFHLEEIIEKRTEEIMRSNKELEQFAYVASHDLQEPLRMVSSYTQLLSDKYRDKLDKKANEYIYYAVDGATRMQQLINDLLSYSRINSQGNAFSEVDSLSVLKESLNNLSKMIEDSGAVITNDQLPSVIADKFQLLQVFQNLIGNGIKFHKPGKIPHIHISAEIKGKKAIFSIKDNGIGIEKEYLSQIFNIFQRLHTRSEYSGTGIGLAVCKRIINRHGGEIWIESESGKGSTFYFYLKKS